MAEQKRTILHADDEASWRDYVKSLLSDQYQVEFAKDFESTLARLEKGGIDLLILDHLMPGTEPNDDAVAVCAELRQKYPKLPVLVFSGALIDAPMTREEFERAVGAPVVLKEDAGSNRELLRARVEECLR